MLGAGEHTNSCSLTTMPPRSGGESLPSGGDDRIRGCRPASPAKESNTNSSEPPSCDFDGSLGVEEFLRLDPAGGGDSREGGRFECDTMNVAPPDWKALGRGRERLKVLNVAGGSARSPPGDLRLCRRPRHQNEEGSQGPFARIGRLRGSCRKFVAPI